MKLTLVYGGPLKSNGSKEHKHQIRKVFDEQLRAFWRTEPLASHEQYALGHASSDLAEVYSSVMEDREQNSEDWYVEEVGGEFFCQSFLTHKIYSQKLTLPGCAEKT